MPSFLGYIEKEGKLPAKLTFSLAALMAFYTGCETRDKALIGHRDGQEYNIMDDMAVLEFFRDNSGKSSAEFAANFLGREDFFGQNLNEVEGLTNAVTADDATATRGSWSVEDNVWTPDTSVSLATLTWAANTNLADDSVVPYATRDQYVLPQTLSDNVTVSVTYTVTQKHNGATIGVKQYTPDPIKLNTMGLTSWEMNKNITYTISIIAKRNQIFFDPAVEEWASDANGAVTIQ